MEQSKPSYYGILPASVRYDKTIPPGAKVLYSELTALCSKEGYCWASNGFFADLYDVNKMTISTWIKALKDAGHINVNYDNNSKNNDTVRKIYIGTPKKTWGDIEKTIGTPIEKSIPNNTSNNNKKNNDGEYSPPLFETENLKQEKQKPGTEDGEQFKAILKWFFDNNPDFSMNKKRGGIIKNIEKRCNGKGYGQFLLVSEKLVRLKETMPWWEEQPIIPETVLSLWERILEAKLKLAVKKSSQDELKELYGG